MHRHTVIHEINNVSTGKRSPQSLHNESVHCWRPLAHEIRLQWKNLHCPLVSHTDYMPS